MSDNTLNSLADAMVELSLGDKVRFSYEGVVTALGEREFTLGNGLKFEYTAAPGYPQTIEILERADDPSRDLVGTVRANQFVKLSDHIGRNWWDLCVGCWTSGGDDLADCPVTGAVPGSPASVVLDKQKLSDTMLDENATPEPRNQAQVAHVSRESCLLGWPPDPEIGLGAPEPDQTKVYRANNGWDWQHDIDGWFQANRNSGYVSPRRYGWVQVQGEKASGFPWRVKAA